VAQIRPGLVGQGALDIVLDRAQAITGALRQAAANDVVLVAGKGHEDYQETAGVRQPFSDRQQVGLALQARRTGVAS